MEISSFCFEPKSSPGLQFHTCLPEHVLNICSNLFHVMVAVHSHYLSHSLVLLQHLRRRLVKRIDPLLNCAGIVISAAARQQSFQQNSGRAFEHQDERYRADLLFEILCLVESPWESCARVSLVFRMQLFGLPSRKNDWTPSLATPSIACFINLTVNSFGPMRPSLMFSRMSSAYGLPGLTTSARSRSPTLRCAQKKRFWSSEHCVPLPEPGGPRTEIFLGSGCIAGE